MRILFLGIQGSGKGTQAELLSKEFNVDKIAAGDLLRGEKNKGTKLGKEIAKIMDEGKLVPDEIIYNLIKQKIKNKENYILDGFPRSLGQVKLATDIEIEKVIYIKISDKIIFDRLNGRLTCKNCGAVYHLKYNKPKFEGKCNDCNGDLCVRDDETRDAIKQRIKFHKEQTMPLINYYRKKKILFEIDGNKPIDDVYKNIRKLFK